MIKHTIGETGEIICEDFPELVIKWERLPNKSIADYEYNFYRDNVFLFKKISLEHEFKNCFEGILDLYGDIDLKKYKEYKNLTVEIIKEKINNFLEVIRNKTDNGYNYNSGIFSLLYTEDEDEDKFLINLNDPKSRKIRFYFDVNLLYYEFGTKRGNFPEILEDHSSNTLTLYKFALNVMEKIMFGYFDIIEVKEIEIAEIYKKFNIPLSGTIKLIGEKNEL